MIKTSQIEVMMATEVLGCESFTQHCWKSNICSNCFCDKNKHIGYPQLVNTNKSRSLFNDISEGTIPVRTNLGPQTNGKRNGVLHEVTQGITCSLIPHNVDKLNVLGVDQYVKLSKQTCGPKEHIRAQISLTQDEQYPGLCEKRKERGSSYEEKTRKVTQTEVEGGRVSCGEKPLSTRIKSQCKSGNDDKKAFLSQQSNEEGNTEANVDLGFSLGQKESGATPTHGGKSRAFESNLQNGSSLGDEGVFACIKEKVNHTHALGKIDNLDTNGVISVEEGIAEGKNIDLSQEEMVVVRVKTIDTGSENPQRMSSGDDPAAYNRFQFARNTPPLNANIAGTCASQRESDCRDEFKEQGQTKTYTSTTNHTNFTEERRNTFENRRRSREDSIDSTDEGIFPRVQRKFVGDYECMSSPDSWSTSGSNRSSNTSSLHGYYSPDNVSLSSFNARLNFGRSEESKRSSQASTASQDSGRQYWEKHRDSLDWSDGGIPQLDRRCSNDHIYENTSNQCQDVSLKYNKRTANMEEDEEIPPPLPARQSGGTTINIKPPVEMIMPYKVVDLEELQRSLEEDIEPYYIGSDVCYESEDELYKDCMEPENKTEQTGDFRPVLPPKQRTLSHSKSDSSCCTAVGSTRDKPVPLPRQSVILADSTLPGQTTESDVISTDEDTNFTVRSVKASGHLSRQKSLPVGRVTRSRRSSTSPHKTFRPRRNAPPPPPVDKGPSSRPVSEMFPKTHAVSPIQLKRSLTVSVLSSPTNRSPLGGNFNEDSPPDAQNCLQVSSIPPTALTNGSTSQQTEVDCRPIQPKDDTTKSGSSRTSAFFAKSNNVLKALISLKKPGTKKPAKKELVIGPPTDFTSLYGSRVTADYTERERKTVSFVDNGEYGEKVESSPEPCTEAAEDADEQVYHNFPISQAIDSPEQLLSPTKPPRRFTTSEGYLEPSTSQRTKEQEDEISQNKLPELGPLPSPPALQSPVGKDAPTKESPGAGTKVLTNGEAEKPATKPKPAVPRRPESLKLGPKIKSAVQVGVKPKPYHRSATLPTPTVYSLREPAVLNNDRRHSPLEETAGRSRSCELLSVDDPRDTYLADMHMTVLKDILLRWRNMLRKPAISLSGACWEDFEVVEVQSWPKVSDVHASVLQPVQLKTSARSLGGRHNCDGQFIAKIKSVTPPTKSAKSPYDQDYSICTSVEPHENIARVLAYFRGDIQSPLLCLENGLTQVHTTISISDQVPALTCEEFVAQSVESHNKDPYSYERTVCVLMLQCLTGLSHLHNSGYAHGNLTLSNMFLIKHTNDFQLFLGNFGKSQPLPKERRGSSLNCKPPEDHPKLTGLRNDLTACSDVLSAMLHTELIANDQNGNLVAKPRTSGLFRFLEKASARLREGTTTLYQVVSFLQALLWGPFKLDENIVILSESRMTQWLERERGEFIARLAMDEALSRTMKTESRGFSMEDLMLCEYLTVANSSSLIRTEKYWFFDS